MVVFNFLYVIFFCVVCRLDYIVDIFCCVFNQCQNWFLVSVVKFVVFGNGDFVKDSLGVDYGQKVIDIFGIEGLEVQDLFVEGVGDFQFLISFNCEGNGFMSGNKRYVE